LIPPENSNARSPSGCRKLPVKSEVTEFSSAYSSELGGGLAAIVATLVAFGDLGADVVEEVLLGVGVLAGGGFAASAGREAVGGTFDNDHVFVLSGSGVEFVFGIADEIVRAHGDEQGGNRGLEEKSAGEVCRRSLQEKSG
jgi:hypothetical protein